MRTLHVIGLLLWRGGLLLAGSYVLYQTIASGLALLASLGVQIPTAPKVGFALVLGGMVCVLLSVIMERVHDARQEQGGDL